MHTNNAQAMTRLLELIEAHPDIDMLTLLEKWRTGIEQYELEQQAQRSAMLPPQMYGLQYGEVAQTSSDPSHAVFNYVPTAKYRIKREDIGEFARSNKLSLKELMKVLDGIELEYQGYRTMWFSGSLSKAYTPPKEGMTDRERKEEVGRRYTPGSTSFVPSNIEPAYQRKPDVTVSDWIPGSKKDN